MSDHIHMQTKICGKCKEEKPVEEFYKRTASKDGLSPRCKECISQDQKLYREKEPFWYQEGYSNYKDYRKFRDSILKQGIIKCRGCGQDKTKDNFYRDKKGSYQLVCRECRAGEALQKKQKRKNNKLCAQCGEPSDTYYCKRCSDISNKKVRERRRETKIDVVKYKGGSCKVCGLRCASVEVYDFHHTYGSKEACISNLLRTRSMDDKDLIEELDKCMLICRNCHRTLHYLANRNTKTPKQRFKDELKQMAIDYKGGVCCQCNQSFSNISVYDFHHLNPNEKEYTISCLLHSNRLLRWEEMKKELDKCILVCANCHQIIHHGEEEIK